MGPLTKALLAGSSLVAIAGVLASARQAMADTTISAATAAQQNWANTNFTITNTGTISNPAIGVNATGTDSGTLTIFSGGKISATGPGIKVNGTATIGTISNSGSITAGSPAITIVNGATISAVNNTGTLNGGNTDIANSGRILTLTNSGTLLKGFSNLAGGTITSVNNSGTITAGSGTAILNQNATIGTLTNSGTITFSGGNGVGLAGGSIGLIDNSRLISAGNTGFKISSGTLGTLTNSGTISGATNAINYTGGSIGQVSLSGVLAGSIVNSTANVLTIAGSSGSGFGVLTGYNSGTPSESSPGAVGSITSTTANLVFSSGNLLLNDNINATGRTVSNTGAVLKVQNTLTITGVYSQSGGGLVVVAASSSSYGVMSITGNATVSNATITISGSSLAKGDTYTIVRSGGTGTYTGDTATVTGTRGLSGSVSTSGNNLVVTLATATSTAYSSLGTIAGGAATGVGSTLDKINTSTSAAATAFQTNVLDKLDALPSSSQPAAVKQLAPSQMTPAVQVATQAVIPVTTAVEQRQLNVAASGEVGMAAGSAGHDSALWGQVLAGTATRDTNSAADGFHARHFGLMTGFDRQVTDDLMLGVAVSWLTGRSFGRDTSSGSAVTTDTYQLTGYGLQRWDQFFVDGQLGAGFTRFRQDRAITFLGSTASAKYDGMLYLAKAGVGYDIPVDDSVTLTPLASLRILRTTTHSYTEYGAGSANLAVDAQTTMALTQEIGGKLAWSTTTEWGALKPEIRAAWVHDYRNSPIAASGVMGGEAFTSTVARPAADGARINLAATLETGRDFSLRAEVESEIRHDYRSQTGLVKATVEF